MPSWTPCGGGRRGGLNRPRFDTKKLWLPSGSPHPRHPGPLRLQPADLLLLRGRQPSRSPPATRACTKTVRRWVASSQRITGASSPVPFLEHSWGRRGAAQPVRRCPSPLPHLVRARFRGPFPWGKSGPGWAHLAIGHPHHPAKALVTRIGVRPEGNTREDPRSDVCPSQKHLTVRERGVEPPARHARTWSSLGIMHISCSGQRLPWGRCGAERVQSLAAPHESVCGVDGASTSSGAPSPREGRSSACDEEAPGSTDQDARYLVNEQSVSALHAHRPVAAVELELASQAQGDSG